MNAEPAPRSSGTQEPTTAPSADLPRRFGRYQLFDRIGQGGMATIYLARMESELGAERLVVVKQIHDALSRDPAFSTQFVDEAKLCAGLRHANIAQVVDLGRGPSADGGPGALFMAMEYVEGFDLQQLLRNLAKAKIPMPPEFVFHIVRETLAGLDFAHRAVGPSGPLGIVHRDVSPSNVLLSFEGEVKLCDFGIAKAYGRAGEMGLGAEDTGEAPDASAELGARVVGKSAYMSPEHARGEALDARADVFAAGILLWEMCAGRRLYKGSELEMLELAKGAVIPRLPSRGLAGHDELQALLDGALAPDRDMRFPTAKAMLDALDAYLARHRIVPSQLRFATFLTDHFGEQVIAERRQRERAARELATAVGERIASAAERAPEPPSTDARPPRRFPMPEIDDDVLEQKTVMKPLPRAGASGAAPSSAGPSSAGPSSAGPSISAPSISAPSITAPSSAGPSSAGVAAAPAQRGSALHAQSSQGERIDTAHLAIGAVVLMLLAAGLGALLFYLVAR